MEAARCLKTRDEIISMRLKLLTKLKFNADSIGQIKNKDTSFVFKMLLQATYFCHAHKIVFFKHCSCISAPSILSRNHPSLLAAATLAPTGVAGAVSAGALRSSRTSTICTFLALVLV